LHPFSAPSRSLVFFFSPPSPFFLCSHLIERLLFFHRQLSTSQKQIFNFVRLLVFAFSPSPKEALSHRPAANGWPMAFFLPGTRSFSLFLPLPNPSGISRLKRFSLSYSGALHRPFHLRFILFLFSPSEGAVVTPYPPPKTENCVYYSSSLPLLLQLKPAEWSSFLPKVS